MIHAFVISMEGARMRWFFLFMLVGTTGVVNSLFLRDLLLPDIGFLVSFNLVFLSLGLIWYHAYFTQGSRQGKGRSQGLSVIVLVTGGCMIWQGVTFITSGLCEPGSRSHRLLGMLMDFIQTHGYCALAGVLFMLMGLQMAYIAYKLFSKRPENPIW
jgi:hypothetical protein